jgi:hypothetical protein
MTISEAIRHAIDSGTEINAEGCYRMAVHLEQQPQNNGRTSP